MSNSSLEASHTFAGQKGDTDATFSQERSNKYTLPPISQILEIVTEIERSGRLSVPPQSQSCLPPQIPRDEPTYDSGNSTPSSPSNLRLKSVTPSYEMPRYPFIELQYPVNTAVASKTAAERRRRNAEASSRFCRRKKQRAEDTYEKIKTLEAELDSSMQALITLSSENKKLQEYITYLEGNSG